VKDLKEVIVLLLLSITLLCSLQEASGGLEDVGNWLISREKSYISEESVGKTAVTVYTLLRLYNYTGRKEFLSPAIEGISWLRGQRIPHREGNRIFRVWGEYISGSERRPEEDLTAIVIITLRESLNYVKDENYKKNIMKDIKNAGSWLIRQTWTNSTVWKVYVPQTCYMMEALMYYSDLQLDEREQAMDSLIDAGDWLISIQNEEGYWGKGDEEQPLIIRYLETYYASNALIELYRRTGDQRFIKSASRGVEWLSSKAKIGDLLTKSLAAIVMSKLYEETGKHEDFLETLEEVKLLLERGYISDEESRLLYTRFAVTAISLSPKIEIKKFVSKSKAWVGETLEVRIEISNSGGTSLIGKIVDVPYEGGEEEVFTIRVGKGEKKSVIYSFRPKMPGVIRIPPPEFKCCGRRFVGNTSTTEIVVEDRKRAYMFLLALTLILVLLPYLLARASVMKGGNELVHSV